MVEIFHVLYFVRGSVLTENRKYISCKITNRTVDRYIFWLKFLSFPFLFLFPASPPSFLSPSSAMSPPSVPHSLPPLVPLSAGVVQTYRHSYFGAGTHHMLIGNLYCYGFASQLSECYGVRYSYIPRYACSPYSSHVAGVKCIGEYHIALIFRGSKFLRIAVF